MRFTGVPRFNGTRSAAAISVICIAVVTRLVARHNAVATGCNLTIAVTAIVINKVSVVTRLMRGAQSTVTTSAKCAKPVNTAFRQTISVGYAGKFIFAGITVSATTIDIRFSVIYRGILAGTGVTHGTLTIVARTIIRRRTGRTRRTGRAIYTTTIDARLAIFCIESLVVTKRQLTQTVQACPLTTIAISRTRLSECAWTTGHPTAIEISFITISSVVVTRSNDTSVGTRIIISCISIVTCFLTNGDAIAA